MEHPVDGVSFYHQYLRQLEFLAQQYRFVRIQTAGRTGLGRGLFTLSVGHPTQQSLIVAGFSGAAGEHSLLLLAFLRRVCGALEHKTPLFDVDLSRAFRDCGVTLLPCLNPDGMEIHARGAVGAGSLKRFVLPLLETAPWQANANGVDLMKNVPFDWALRRTKEQVDGTSAPCAAGCAGSAPGSEAEIRALTRLCRKTPFRKALALHGSGSIVRSRDLYAPTGTTCIKKLLADCCGYDVGDTPDDSAACAFSDWFSATFARPALTMEPGKGPVPSPDTEDDFFDERLAEALTLFALL